MKKMFSIYRITLLLYVGVLLLPFGFYYTYNYMKEVSLDTQMIAQFNRLNTNILTYQHIQNVERKLQQALSIEREVEKLTPWFDSKDKDTFYVGGRSLAKDFSLFITQWKSFQNYPSSLNKEACIRSTKSLSFTLSTMMMLKQERINNLFFINIILSSIFLLLLIYFTRTYIHCQLNKQSIYDKETQLFNQNYFESQLNISCAQAKRTKQPLSLISVKMNLEDSNFLKLSKKEKNEVLGKFGNLILSLTRVSDMACRCNKENITIFTPDTKKESALLLQERIERKLQQDPTLLDAAMHFKFTTVQYDCDESIEELLERMREEID
jgi:diguanylate cyclase (GGDEF)-like protein